MMRRVRPVVASAVGAVVVALAATGCSSDSTPTSSATSVLSAAQSALSAAASAASSVASEAASAASALPSAVASAASGVASEAASARAAASSALASVKGGRDGKGDVTLGSVAPAANGRVQVPVTVVNHDSQGNEYLIQVDFKDTSGNVLDVVVVDVEEVAPGATAQTTAQSNRALTGSVAASVEAALRY
ncbi:hypothetical protein [Kitasatospora camelliae]|uniref:Lipoprotein n=1 Tax=Kitasatospora camelliae TaxID=3156397 RepID=A0AAU8JVW6_9ACTN